MPQFIFTYHCGKKPETPKEGQKGMKNGSITIDKYKNERKVKITFMEVSN